MSWDVGDEDDSIDINLRSTEEIAGRMIVLASIVRRAAIEMPLDDDDDELDSPQGEQFDLVNAFTTGELASLLTPRERSLLLAPLGQIDEETALTASWQVEALAALAAASVPGRILTDPWKQTDPGPLLSMMPEPWEDIAAFAGTLALFDEETIAAERERAELWLWRCAVDDEIRTSHGKERKDLLYLLKETAREAERANMLPTTRDDFAVGASRFGDADPETRAVITEISTQRLHALNWLCGFGATWDEVPLDL